VHAAVARRQNPNRREKALAGIDAGSDPGAPVAGNAYALELEPLPKDLSAAAARFADSEWAAAAFGRQVIEHYAAPARFEWAEFMKAVTDWERLRYFELA
jgi:glutamine synthetase